MRPCTVCCALKAEQEPFFGIEANRRFCVEGPGKDIQSGGESSSSRGLQWLTADAKLQALIDKGATIVHISHMAQVRAPQSAHGDERVAAPLHRVRSWRRPIAVTLLCRGERQGCGRGAAGDGRGVAGGWQGSEHEARGAPTVRTRVAAVASPPFGRDTCEIRARYGRAHLSGETMKRIAQSRLADCGVPDNEHVGFGREQR